MKAKFNNHTIHKNDKNNSTTPNTKLSQYLEKNKLLHKSPNALNKSQNLTKLQKNHKTSLKYIMVKNNKNSINAKKIIPTKNFKHNQNTKSLSKNSSLSNYCFKIRVKNNDKITNFINHKRNNTNTNIIDKSSNLNNNSSINYVKNNKLFYKTKSNLCSITHNYNSKNTIYNKSLKKSTTSNLNNKPRKYKKESHSPFNRIKNYLTTEDLLNSRNLKNLKHSLYSYVITEDYKKNDKSNNASYFQNNKKIKNVSKKNFNAKVNNSNVLSLKKYSTASNAGLVLNSKSNTPINIPYKQMINSIPTANPISSSGGVLENLSTEKTNSCNHLDTVEYKIINEIKELRNINDNNEKINKLKLIFEEVIDYFIPKESQNVFLLISKEFGNINDDNNKKINQLKLDINESNNKLKSYEKKYNELLNKFIKKEKEIMNIKKDNKKEIKRGNEYFKMLNKKNVNDLDALYFYDKIKDKNDYAHDSKEKRSIPKLNLDANYIEKCKQKELDKINEANLTPFQKIALQFENTET